MANESARRDTILVVDDTPETLGLLTDTLDHAGFTVLIATDGHSALELLDQITPETQGITALVGCPLFDRDLANACAVLGNGELRLTLGPESAGDTDTLVAAYFS